MPAPVKLHGIILEHTSLPDGAKGVLHLLLGQPVALLTIRPVLRISFGFTLLLPLSALTFIYSRQFHTALEFAQHQRPNVVREGLAAALLRLQIS